MSMSTPGAAGTLAELAEAAERAVAAVRDGGLAGAGTAQLARVITTVRRVQAQAEWITLTAAREVDLSKAHVADGALTAQSWLRQRARMSPGEAGAVVRTARALGSGSLEATSSALAAGEIDPAHARLIARDTVEAPAGAVALIEPLALRAARECPPGRVAEVMRDFRQALDPDDGDAAAVRRYEQRGLSAATTLDGMVAGRFLLDPAAGSSLLTALDAAAPLVTGERRCAPQRRADALADIASHFLATAHTPRTAGARPHVVVTTTTTGTDGTNGTDSAATADECPTGDARLSWIGPVPRSTADRVACDAQVTVVGIDPAGESRDLSSRRRFFTWPQRLAMIARDGDRCPWPWCDRPVWWADGHHLRHWSRGGPTTVANGSLPCAGHHQLLHEGRWQLVRLPDGRYVARHPAGRTLGPEPFRRPRGLHPPPPRRE